MVPSQLILTCSVIALGIAGCATPRGQVVPVPLPPSRIQQQGYSFVPLDEQGWFVLARTPATIGLVKEGVNADETFVIQAMLFPLPAFGHGEDLLRIVKEGQAKDIDPKRFRVMKHDVQLDPRRQSECTMSQTVAEDNGATKRSGRSDAMVLEMLTLTCAHPRSKGVAVNIAYSHRHYPEDEDSRFTEKANQVFKSVQFTGE
jgi:hypothetical protein